MSMSSRAEACPEFGLGDSPVFRYVPRTRKLRNPRRSYMITSCITPLRLGMPFCTRSLMGLAAC